MRNVYAKMQGRYVNRKISRSKTNKGTLRFYFKVFIYFSHKNSAQNPPPGKMFPGKCAQENFCR